MNVCVDIKGFHLLAFHLFKSGYIYKKKAGTNPVSKLR